MPAAVRTLSPIRTKYPSDALFSPGVISAFPLREGAGTVIKDIGPYGGLGNFGAGGAAPSWVADRDDWVISFDGGDDIILAVKPGLTRTIEAFTVLVWVYATSYTVNSGIVDKNDYAITIGVTTAGADWEFYSSDGSRALNINKATVGYAGKWLHLALTGRVGATTPNMVAYIDGKQVGTSSNVLWEGAKNAGVVNFSLGQNYSYKWTGRISEFLVFNRSLSAAEVFARFSRGRLLDVRELSPSR